jgi:hypothetical protein
MTSPEDDDGLEEALRRALSEAASGVEPATDGLDKIRARIGGRPPRPWLLSVLFGVVERVRYWSWRGHWAWPASLSKLSGLRGPRSRRSNFPRWGLGSLRLAVVLAGIAAIAAITLGIQPFRHVILQASAALNGDSGSQQVNTGTEGTGTPTADGSAAPAVSAAAGGQTGASGSPAASSTSSNGKLHPAATAKCVTSTLPVVVGTRSSVTDVTPRASGTAVPDATTVPAATAGPAATTGPATTTTTGSAAATGPATPSPAASAQPYDSGTSAVTCPVSAATESAAPTPTTSPSSPVATPAATAQAPDYGYPSATPTPTASAVAPSSSDDDSPSPSAPPSWWSWPDRRRGHGGNDSSRSR